ncbi:MAG: FRG domain-containing protein [Bacteroidales bacterium]|nr:FRG domain-containing protein [Bacteroidales bacterium]
MIGISKNIKSTKVQDFSGFLEEIKVAERYIKLDGNADFLIFRGQPLDKDLLPKIGREEYIQPDMLSLEKDIFEEFKRLCLPHLDNIKISDWEMLALAQHYYLPTRLLDWTENPLIALWFAFNEKMNKDTERVIWCFGFNKSDILKPTNADFFTHKRTIVYQPNHVTKRITNQTGWFTSHYYGDVKNRYSALNNLSKHWKHLYKITFQDKSDSFSNEILSQLNTFGINSYSIFPDLEGLSKYLDWKTFKKDKVTLPKP